MTVERWVDVTTDGRTVRHTLQQGLTRLGGAGSDVSIPGAVDELHVWSDPPKVIHAGTASRPLLNGRAFEEVGLSAGDSIQWGPIVLVFGWDSPASASVEEVHPEPAASAPAPSGGVGTFVLRLRAGVLADLGLARGREVQRWQDAVLRGEFDPDACARDLIAGDVPGLDDVRVLERAARLQRDLLMSPLQRGIQGASRRARTATKRGTAYVVANLIAITVYSLVLVAIMVLVRVNYDFSFDGVIDRFLGAFR